MANQFSFNQTTQFSPQQFLQQPSTQQNSLDLNNFKNMLFQLNETHFRSLISQARAAGVSDTDIQDGLNLINSMRK